MRAKLQTLTDSSSVYKTRARFSVIVPTLNERAHISSLLESIGRQSVKDIEVIVVDGGSRDGTTSIAGALGAKVVVLEGSSEFEARNYAAALSNASILIFSCADVMFPSNVIERILDRFEKNANLAALTGPGIPYDGGFRLQLVYGLYNTLRSVFSRLPHPIRVFSTSTNFLVVRKEAFRELGGFKMDDVNADGLMGRALAEQYRTCFDDNAIVYISGRRALGWGIARFAKHYAYVLENFLPQLSNQAWFRNLKSRSKENHATIHTSRERRE